MNVMRWKDEVCTLMNFGKRSMDRDCSLFFFLIISERKMSSFYTNKVVQLKVSFPHFCELEINILECQRKKPQQQ